MSSSKTYSIKLPYLGTIFFGKTLLTLQSLQKRLQDLCMLYYQQTNEDERRIIISENDILIYEPNTAVQGKRSFLCASFQSIVDIQILKPSLLINNKQMQVAFLPIGSEQEQRFHSLYLTINQSQYDFFSSSSIFSHSTFILFIIRKPGVSNTCSLLDCHVFAVHRELTAFELSDMIRKLIIKQTISPILLRKRTLICHQQSPTKNELVSNVVVQTSRNPLPSSSVVRNNVPSTYDTSKVLTVNSDSNRMSSKQRHFIKTSKLTKDESDEIVNDLMNIVETEKLKSQGAIKRHGSYDQIFDSDDNTMNKKRYFYNRKRLSTPIPIITQQGIRPELIVNNRYGDIGNYVPKFLRENIAMRSSDSNENIFFRSTNGHLLNGFLKLDFLSTTTAPPSSFNENYHPSKPYIRKNQTNSVLNGSNRMLDMETNYPLANHRISRPLTSLEDVLHGIKNRPLTHANLIKPNVLLKPKRASSLNLIDTQSSVDYRQYLRHTDQGAYLYGRKKRQQSTVEHSLDYYP